VLTLKNVTYITITVAHRVFIKLIVNLNMNL